MHILILPAWYPASPDAVHGVFFRDQAQALSQFGHQVGVIAPMMQSLRARPLRFCAGVMFENDDGVNTYRQQVVALLPKIPYGNYALFLRSARTLLKRYIQNHGKPDILHAHAAVFAGAAGAALSKAFNIPLVLTEHSSGFSRQLYSPWQLKLSAKAVAQAKRCIAVSPALTDTMSELMVQRFGLSRQWHWVPNVVAERFQFQSHESDHDRPLRFLNLGMMNENKGQAELLAAFSRFSDSGIQAELWIGGDGALRESLVEKARTLKIHSRVRFLGQVAPEAVPDLFCDVDILLIGSHYETFGVVAAEALMSGVPVISTRCGGPECVVGADDGLLVPARNPAVLSDAMLEMAASLDRYDRPTIADRAKARFSGEAISRTLTEAYRSVLSET